jgi:hypothetical protein
MFTTEFPTFLAYAIVFGTLIFGFERKRVNFRDNISYQIHSNNDLREFHQNLLKGSRRFKFDPYYVQKHPLCGEHSCFILSHDKPLQFITTYNTSDDLLEYLGGTELQSLSNYSYISIALCFKDAPDFCDKNSGLWRDWVQLVDKFHSKALSLIPLNIEVILDGSASPVDCLVGKWRPWKSVWYDLNMINLNTVQ